MERFKNQKKMDIDWLAGGICRISQTKINNITYKIDEPLIVTAIQHYLQEKHVSLEHYVARQLFELQGVDDSVLGHVFELVVMLSFIEGSASMKSIFESIWWMKSETIPDLKCDSLCDRKRFEEYLDYHLNAVLRPERALGPDGVITKFPFQILFASKTTYRVNKSTTRKSVDTRDINENERSLKFQNFFSEKDEGNKKPSERSRSERKQAVFNWYVNAKLQGIFRLHFILPYATTSNQHNFKPGTITLSKCNIGKGCQVQIATVDIDSSCFKICDIFGHQTLELLKKKISN